MDHPVATNSTGTNSAACARLRVSNPCLFIAKLLHQQIHHFSHLVRPGLAPSDVLRVSLQARYITSLVCESAFSLWPGLALAPKSSLLLRSGVPCQRSPSFRRAGAPPLPSAVSLIPLPLPCQSSGILLSSAEPTYWLRESPSHQECTPCCQQDQDSSCPVALFVASSMHRHGRCRLMDPALLPQMHDAGLFEEAGTLQTDTTKQ